MFEQKTCAFFRLDFGFEICVFVHGHLNTLAAACITGNTFFNWKCVAGDTRGSQRVKVRHLPFKKPFLTLLYLLCAISSHLALCGIHGSDLFFNQIPKIVNQFLLLIFSV